MNLFFVKKCGSDLATGFHFTETFWVMFGNCLHCIQIRFLSVKIKDICHCECIQKFFLSMLNLLKALFVIKASGSKVIFIEETIAL